MAESLDLQTPYPILAPSWFPYIPPLWIWVLIGVLFTLVFVYAKLRAKRKPTRIQALSLLAKDLRRLSQQAETAPEHLQDGVSLRLRRALSSLSGEAFDTLSLSELTECGLKHRDEHIRALALILAPLEESKYSGKSYLSKKLFIELIEAVEALAAREGL